MVSGKVVSMDESEGQVCPNCETWKPWDGFHRDKTQRNGVKKICRECRSDVQRKYREDRVRPDKTEYDLLVSKARQMALRRVAENHWDEFTGLVKRYKRELGIKPTWNSICD